jgi:TonB-linked SusC/RagA family outer membrane protein
MKKYFTKSLTLILVLLGVTSFSQRTITGTVTDAKTGDKLQGVSVGVKGTTTGVVTDAMGNFTVTMPAQSNTLVFSFVGMKTKEMMVGAENVVNVMMEADVLGVDEVTVTALGIKREKKSLGYSVQDVKGDVLTTGGNTNAVGALSGKVAGLQITSTAGTPGSATYMRLRGATTFLNSNQPLIVIDGMPVDNSSAAVGNPDDLRNVELEAVSGSNRSVDINPDDIESISVLKGPAAAALYGSEGANGVILITTKKGKAAAGGQKYNISYNGSMTWDMVNKLPELQTKFVQGLNGQYRGPATATRDSWGPRGDTMAWDGSNTNPWDKNGNLVSKNSLSAQKPFEPYDNAGKFFRTGVTTSHNVSIAGGSDNTSFRISLGRLNQSGIIPLSEFTKTNLSLNGEMKLTSKLTFGATANFTNSGGNFVQQGSNLSGIMLGLLRTPNSFDNSNGTTDPEDRTAFYFPNGDQRTYRGTGIYDNPYFTINENKYHDNLNRLFGNVYGMYQLMPWLSVTERLGSDYYSDNSQQNYAINSGAYSQGRIYLRNELYRHVNNDLILAASRDLNKDLNLGVNLGWNVYSENYMQTYGQGDGLIVPEWYNIANTKAQVFKQPSLSTFRRMSEYLQVKLAYKSYLFLDLTARNEKASSFISDINPSGKTNLYPSASLGFVWSDLVKLPKWMNYGKLRASYAIVGKNPAPYFTKTAYFPTYVIDGWTNGIVFPLGGIPGFESGILLDPNLKPEKTSSSEIGLEFKFLEGRLGIDYTYYMSNSSDLLIRVPISRASGYGEFYTNAGSMENNGHELLITGTPVKNKNLQWDITLNWSRNRNKVTKLAEGVDFITLNGFTGGVVGAKVDEPYGVFYGKAYVKDDAGNLIINDKPGAGFGYPIISDVSSALGNVNPSWIGGIRNDLTWKGIHFSILFDTRQGGVMWNGTRGAIVALGTAKETENRETETKVFAGKLGHLDANGNIVHGAGNEAGAGDNNSTSVKLDQVYYRGVASGFNVTEPYMEDASWIKLRELSIGYHFDSKMLHTTVVKGVDLNLIGRNMWLWTKYKGVDPETSLTGAQNSQGMDYFNNPGTRSFGVNLRVMF